MLFKRKVKIRDYCCKKFDFIFSENGKIFMDNSLIDGGISVDPNSKNTYYSNFIAAYFELTEIAFSRTLSRALRYQAMDIQSEYLNKHNASHIYDLIGIYNAAFGSSFEDGIKPMARIMAERITSKNLKNCEKYFYGLFYGILEAFFRDIKAIKIVS